MNDDSKGIRKPCQKRSIEKKQIIIDTAKQLFCQNSYYNTTTNEIAKQAGLSIGTLYSYFADKEDILLEILEQYNAHFNHAFDFMDAETNIKFFLDNPRKWFYTAIENLVAAHESQKSLYQEIEALYHSMPAVTKTMDAQNEQMRLATLELLKACKVDLSNDDIETASVILVDFTSSLVDRITFKEPFVDRQKLMKMGAETLYRVVFPS